MGGVVKAIEKVVDPIVDGVKKGLEILEDAGKLAIDIAKAPTQIIYDTVIKGESFSGSVAKQIQEVGKDLGDIYNSLLDDTLGIDDGKFLGIKGSFFEKLGMLTKDFFHDHATETVGIGVIVALIVVSIIFPPAYGTAGAVALAAFEAGITSSIALMTAYYATLTSITLGISSIISGIIDGAILAMYPNLLNDMFLFEQGQESLRIAGLTAIMSGGIFDRLAGGVMYDSQFAGGVYYDASTCANLNISVGGEFALTPHTVRTQFGYQDMTMKNLPGDKNFSIIKM